MTNEVRPADTASPKPKSAKPKPAAKASRWVAVGAAVGSSLAMVGAMAGAAESKPEPTAAPVIRRIVVVEAPEPHTDARPTTAPQARKTKPVTESSGS